MGQDRVIALIDGNCFFASCLQAAHPHLKGRPVVVAGDPAVRHGVILAVSYEARRAARGPVRAGMPLGQARRLLGPDVIIMPPDHDLFEQYSDRMYGVLERFSPLNERASIDEVYADWTGCTHLFGGDPVEMARRVKQAIRTEVGIPVSVGIGRSKVMAKVAAELQKPDGLTWLTPDTWRERVWPLPAGDLFGVGPKTVPKLRRLGIYTIGDLAAADPAMLLRVFGVFGPHMRTAARGEDDDPVRAHLPEETKSVSHATTLPRDVADRTALRRVLFDLTDPVGARLRALGFLARTVQLQVRFPSFESVTRSRTLHRPTDVTDIIYEMACTLLDENVPEGQAVRLLGVGVSNFVRPEHADAAASARQLTFFDMNEPASPGPAALAGVAAPPAQSVPVPPEKLRSVDQAVDRIRAKFGSRAIVRVSQIDGR